MVTVIHLEEEIFDKTTREKRLVALLLYELLVYYDETNWTTKTERRKGVWDIKKQDLARWMCIAAAGYLWPSTSYCMHPTREDKNSNMEWTTMYQPGKFECIQREASPLNIDILGLAEVRWTQSGKLTRDDHVKKKSKKWGGCTAN